LGANTPRQIDPRFRHQGDKSGDDVQDALMSRAQDAQERLKSIGHVFTTGGLIAVAVAFALKTVAENLVSGLILRLERDIKRGDALTTQAGEMVKVREIGLRATIARSKADGDLLIPNSGLVQNTISN
jgi:small-conductance mechanosensitive channel